MVSNGNFLYVLDHITRYVESWLVKVPKDRETIEAAADFRQNMKKKLRDEDEYVMRMQFLIGVRMSLQMRDFHRHMASAYKNPKYSWNEWVSPLDSNKQTEQISKHRQEIKVWKVVRKWRDEYDRICKGLGVAGAL